jgi:radical SAM protein with 4Fe4S-binding SPASM domain
VPPPGYAWAIRETERRHYAKYIVAILLRKPPGQWMVGRELVLRFNHLCRCQRIVDTMGAWCRRFRPEYAFAEVAGSDGGALVECSGAVGHPTHRCTRRVAEYRFRIRPESYDSVAAYCARTGMCLLAGVEPGPTPEAAQDTPRPDIGCPEHTAESAGAPQVPPAALSADDAEAVRVFYRELLCREASSEEVVSQLAHNPPHFSRETMLRIILRSWECAHVVAPLREVVREIYQSVLRREADAAEICRHVNAVRERWGDRAAVRAIRSGRIWNLLDIRPLAADVTSGPVSADDAGMVRILYRDLLYREPTSEELASFMGRHPDGVDRETLRSAILSSWERERVVAPLRDMVRRVYESVVLREPSEEEIHHHLNLARDRCGDDEATVRSIRSGRIRRFLGIRPINVELDVTNRCNLRCVMCLHSHPSYYRRKRQDMPLETFRTLAEAVFHTTRGLSLSYGAESLLHPQFEQFLRLSMGYGIPKVYVNTNGLLLTEPTVEAMVSTGLHQLAVSVDAATPETYGKIRVGGDFSKLLGNLRMVRRVRERACSETPHVSLLFVLLRSNVQELPAFVDLAPDVGADSVIAIHMNPYKLLDNADRAAAFDKALCNDMVHEARDRATAHGIALVAPADFALDGDVPPHDRRVTAERFDLAVQKGWEQRAVCPFPWHFVAIDMQGDVVPCGWWAEQPPMGNVYEDDLLEVWRNDRYRVLREELADGRPREVCRTCPAAGMGDPNNPYAFLSR